MHLKETVSVCFLVFIFERLKRKRQSETYTKRQATQYGCLPSLLSDGYKGIEMVYCRRPQRDVVYLS
jgi:hypothetical protein